MSTSQDPAALEAQPWRHSGSLLGVAAPPLVWLLSMVGLLDPFSGWGHDQLMRLSSRLARAPSRVLLVELDAPQNVTDSAYLEMMRSLDSLGARQIVFTFLPTAASSAFFEEAARRGVVFGWPIVPDPTDPDVRRLVEAPPGAKGVGLTFGVVDVPPSSHGIHRAEHAYVKLASETHPVLETAAARRLGADLPSKTRPYLVNFSGGPGSLPAASLERVLSGSLVSELVQGRTVLVGPVGSPPQPGLHTPTTTGAQMMSLLEFQGHALDTLLSGRALRATGPVTTLLLLLFLTLPSLLLYQRLEVRLASWLTLGLVALHVLLAAALFVWARVRLPVVELLLAQGLLFFLSLRGKALLTSLAINNLLLRLTSRLREGVYPPSFYASAEHWSQVINMVNQILDLNRVIFLERIEADHRVREIKSLNCSVNDIDEMRRDYERTPYSTAIEAQGPIRVKKYLKTVETAEDQYLTPLIFAGEILGFWAFGVEPATAAAIPRFETVVRDFGDQISEMLYHRQRVLKDRSESFLSRALRLQREIELYRALSRTVALIERRLGRVEGLLDDLTTAAIMYDLFGRVLEANSRMLELLRAENLAPYDMTALDLVSALTGYAPVQCRRFLRQVIIEKTPVSLPVALPGGRSYALGLRALQSRERQAVPEEVAPFQLTGILCELADTTSLSRLYDVKAHLMQRLGVQVRNDLAALELSSSLLATGGLSEEERREVSSIVHERVADAVETLDDCQRYLAVDADLFDGTERFPIDPHRPLETALDGIRLSAEARSLTLEVVEPRLLSHVFAAPSRLQDVFGRVLSLLVEDAVGGSSLRVHVEEDAKWVTFSFENRGFGMPNDRFQGYLFSGEDSASETARNLRTALRWVQDWGGTVEARSEVGSGTRIDLRFQRFL